MTITTADRSRAIAAGRNPTIRDEGELLEARCTLVALIEEKPHSILVPDWRSYVSAIDAQLDASQCPAGSDESFNPSTIGPSISLRDRAGASHGRLIEPRRTDRCRRT